MNARSTAARSRLRQVPDARVLEEHPHAVLHARHLVEQVGTPDRAGTDQRLEHRPVRVLEVQREVVVVLAPHVVVDLGEVGADVAPDQGGDVLLGQRLLPAQQRQAGREPLEVPGEVADVGLVEVVDVEDQAAVGVQVGAEVLDVQVAVHPDGTALLVDPRVIDARHVRVVEAGGASVERMRVGRHLAVLRAEGLRVGLHQRVEGVLEDLDDLVGACCVSLHGTTLSLAAFSTEELDDSAAGGRRPTDRSSSFASWSMTAGSPRRHAPAGSRSMRARTCSGWCAIARRANRSRSAPESRNRWPGGRATHERDARGQVEPQQREDRDQGHGEAEPVRQALDRCHLLLARVREPGSGPAGPVERAPRLVSDERDAGHGPPRVAQPAGEVVCRRRRSCGRVWPASGSSRGPCRRSRSRPRSRSRRPGPRRSAGSGAWRCRRTASWAPCAPDQSRGTLCA